MHLNWSAVCLVVYVCKSVSAWDGIHLVVRYQQAPGGKVPLGAIWIRGCVCCHGALRKIISVSPPDSTLDGARRGTPAATRNAHYEVHEYGGERRSTEKRSPKPPDVRGLISTSSVLFTCTPWSQAVAGKREIGVSMKHEREFLTLHDSSEITHSLASHISRAHSRLIPRLLLRKDT